MKPFTIAAGIAAMFFATSAGAATLDFMTTANGAETGIANGDSLVMDGVTVTFEATGTSGEAAAYLDSGDAGLGVCSNWTATAAVNDNECAPSSDDNITAGETVTLTLDGSYDLSDLVFRDDGHVPLASDSLTLLFGVNGAALTEYTFDELAAESFAGVTEFTFAYGGSDAHQFYVQAATVVAAVPLPASILLLGGALATLRRRRKSA
ncbi:hypothetical protein [Flavimaricola marinus]|uniref:PEP-CTERM protein-sorting domain-containing protein n=1 Tax=Flavimaricola marinus TaxID=1819565 RepID=A0A238L9J2_9RHOB|nr:hypothetical protein [Flavimaricola marinus]SMY06075.1 hypothetical protein LOM8899_00196 [Flavimaricola marinus]